MLSILQINVEETTIKQLIKQTLVAILLIALATLPFAALAETNVRSAEVWDGSVASGFAGGSGTIEDPYLISNGAEFAYFAQQVNGGTTYADTFFMLTDNICLNDTTGWESWGDGNAPANEWTAIGTATNPFCGNFDGNGHAILGAYINTEGDNLGLFGYILNATVANLGLEESYVCGNTTVGGVVGYNYDSHVSFCYNAGIVTTSSTEGGNVGGVVGWNYGDVSATITNCYNVGNVIAEYNEFVFTGGVVGGNGIGIVASCYNAGNVTGDWVTGGVVGLNFSNVMYCYNMGIINSDDYAGGIVGTNEIAGDVTNCYNAGSVTGRFIVGGVAGYNCVSVANCYNVGRVIGVDYVGAVDGMNEYGTESNCYYLDTSCDNGDGAGTALTDEQMQMAESFPGFDFTEVWTMDGNESYFYPELISNPHGEIVSEPPVETEEPITEEPITEEPITEEPITEEPITEEPITEEPITEEPITEEPITEEPIMTEEPVQPNPPETGAISLIGIGIAAVVSGTGCILLAKKKR